MNVALVILAIILLVAILCAILLVYKRVQRSQRAVENLIKTVFTSVEHRLRYQSNLDGAGEADVVVVVTRDRADYLQAMIRSVAQCEPTAHIVVVDVGSSDDTPRVLHQLCAEGVVYVSIRHRIGTVPQWQKGYGIHEVWRLSSLRAPRSITVIDDDMLVREPFLHKCMAICSTHDTVAVVALHRDALQEKNHPAVGSVIVDGQHIPTGTSFNGAAFYMPWKTLIAWGPPPINEGSNEMSVEDWYYSRALAADNQLAAFYPCVIEQQGAVSLREAVQ
ncbi:MAG: hypothetical protein RL594_764 [Bacteroidota bacterium]|jgi:hypothetical protein